MTGSVLYLVTHSTGLPGTLSGFTSQSSVERFDFTTRIDVRGRGSPVAIVIDAEDRTTIDAKVREIRSRDDALAQVPIVVVADIPPPTGRAYDGIDQFLPASSTTNEIARTLAVWSFDDNAVLDRLIACFGRSEMDAMFAGFRQALADVIGDIRGADMTVRAHQIAGVAGTLGFTALSDCCARLQFDPARVDEAALLVRKTLYHLARLQG